MMEPESELEEGTDLSSVRSDESVTLTNEGNKIKVKDIAFDIVKCGQDDELSSLLRWTTRRRSSRRSRSR